MSSSLKQLFTRIRIETSVERMLTICSNGSAPLNKTAAKPIYGKTLKIFFYRTKLARSTKFVEMMILG